MLTCPPLLPPLPCCPSPAACGVQYYGCLRGHSKSIRTLCNAPSFDGISLLSCGYEFDAYAWNIHVREVDHCVEGKIAVSS